MATKGQAKSAELYEADFYVWAEEQAALLRARRFDAVDLDNLIEEVEGLADTKLSAVLNGARGDGASLEATVQSGDRPTQHMAGKRT